jgi:hypothetical protein
VGKQQKYNKTVAAAAEEKLAWRWTTCYAWARETHAPVSKIYSWALVGYAPVRASQMETRSVSDGSSDAEEHGGMARLRVGFPEIDRSEFEKPKSKNFKKKSDLPKGTIEGSKIRQDGGGGADDAIIERENLKRGR